MDVNEGIVQESQTESGPMMPLLGQVAVFHLGGQRYALPIERVQEIQQIVEFSEVPSRVSSVVGMINLRGEVIPVIDLRRVVGMPAEEYRLETPMIISRVLGQLMALVVDEVQDVIALPGECLQDVPSMHELAPKMVCVARLDDGLVYVLDIDALLGQVGGAS